MLCSHTKICLFYFIAKGIEPVKKWDSPVSSQFKRVGFTCHLGEEYGLYMSKTFRKTWKASGVLMGQMREWCVFLYSLPLSVTSPLHSCFVFLSVVAGCGCQVTSSHFYVTYTPRDITSQPIINWQDTCVKHEDMWTDRSRELWLRGKMLS